MSFDPDAFQLLQSAKVLTVQKLTELNARHISSQGKLSGIEIDKARCTEAIDQGNNTEEFEAELLRLEWKYEELMRSRAVIDDERDALELKLRQIDSQLEQLIGGSL